MTWRNYLLPQERQRIHHIEQIRPKLTREFKQISDRCRKRLAKETRA